MGGWKLSSLAAAALLREKKRPDPAQQSIRRNDDGGNDLSEETRPAWNGVQDSLEKLIAPFFQAKALGNGAHPHHAASGARLCCRPSLPGFNLCALSWQDLGSNHGFRCLFDAALQGTEAKTQQTAAAGHNSNSSRGDHLFMRPGRGGVSCGHNIRK